jgi:hypothetical protein
VTAAAIARATDEPATRAVVSDDGEIRRTLYRDDGEAVAVVLAPPMPEETNPKRGLMQKINGYGLPVGKRQIRKILAQQKTRLKGHGSPRD